MDAGPAARRSPSPGVGDADEGDASATGDSVAPAAAPVAAPARPRRRRFRPSTLRIFLGASAVLAAVFDAAAVLRRARRGPWRAEVAEGSMVPTLLPGDWLLLDPTSPRWPRAGAIVVVREPSTGLLAIKRVAARGRRGRAPVPGPNDGDGPATVAVSGDPARALGSREAWVLGDAADGSIDSRVYGPLDADALVARAWFRYGPLRRIGRLR